MGATNPCPQAHWRGPPASSASPPIATFSIWKPAAGFRASWHRWAAVPPTCGGGNHDDGTSPQPGPAESPRTASATASPRCSAISPSSAAWRCACRSAPTPAARRLLATATRSAIRRSGVADTDADLIKTAIGRVVLACTLKHHTRRGERDPDRWQRASQLVTHGLLRDAGFTLPHRSRGVGGIKRRAGLRPPAGTREQRWGREPTAQLPGPAATPQARNPLPVTTIPVAVAIRPTTAIRKRKAIQPRTAAALNPGNTGDPSNNGDPKDKDGPGTGIGSDTPPSFDPGGTGEIMDAGSRNGDDSVSVRGADWTPPPRSRPGTRQCTRP